MKKEHNYMVGNEKKIIKKASTITKCTRCVMDNETDKTIEFDENGVCNYCRQAETLLKSNYFPDDRGETLFNEMCQRLKKAGEKSKYDCLMEVSGGLDSSYLLMICAKKGLRILAVHIDDGFDTELAKSNIKKLCDKAGVDLRYITPDAEQFNDLTAAYIRAGVCNLAVPQDNVLFACIYRFAIENNIHYFLSGSNLALESILEHGESYPSHDVVNIKDIHRKYGNRAINKIELMSYFKKTILSKIYRIQTLRPLNYIDYNRDRAIAELKDYCGFEYYKAKHLENELTKFVQLYWFYNKFGIDKRKSHLSSLIISNQMTRESALKELSNPPYDDNEMEDTINYILDVLGISKEEFLKIIDAPNHSHYDYKTSKLYNFLRNVKHRKVRK